MIMMMICTSINTTYYRCENFVMSEMIIMIMTTTTTTTMAITIKRDIITMMMKICISVNTIIYY